MNTLIRAFACAALLAASCGQSAPVSKPNIIFMLADDLGWTGLGCYGSPFYETPNIDRLARDGMKFTQACEFQFEKDPPLGTFDSRESLEDFLPGAFQLPSRLF
jgi:hypothetical protein